MPQLETSTHGIERSPTLLGRIVLHLILGFVTLMGVAASIGGLAAYNRGETEFAAAVVCAVVGAVFTAFGIGLSYVLLFVEPRRGAESARMAKLHPDAPWMLRPDWVARKVTDRSSLAVAIFLWVWSAGWCVPMAPRPSSPA